MSRRRVRDGLTRNKERASMSFMIVIMFFIVFVIIVLTEVLLMDERGSRGSGVLVRRGSIIGVQRRSPEKPDYEDFLRNEDDYLTYHGANVAIPRDSLIENSSKFKRIAAMEKRESNINSGGQSVQSLFGHEGVANSHQPLSANLEMKLPKLNLNLTAQDGVWQIVNGTRFKFFVYSAYYERRKNKRSIRVIGATRTRLPERVWCRLWYENQHAVPINVTPTINSSTIFDNDHRSSVTILAEVKVIRENWNLKYSACYVLCPLNKITQNLQLPTTVSIVSKLGYSPANRLIIRNTDKEVDVSNIPQTMGLCVKPLHFHYNLDIEMLEFLELNTILGVTHFTFYIRDLGPQVECILRQYQESRDVNITMLPWKLDMISQQEIRTEGLFMALNDCLYRNMYHHSHLVFIDLDEFIIPTLNNTLMELVTWMSNKMNTKTFGAFSFQNAFFYKVWGDDPAIYETDNALKQSMMVLRKTRRKLKLHPHKQRSKLILRPETVLEVGNHFVWEFMPGFGTFNVPPTAGLLHHYRMCEFGGTDCIKTPSVVDRTAYRYEEKLIKRVADKHSSLKNKCNLTKLPELRHKQASKSVKSSTFRRDKNIRPIFSEFNEKLLQVDS